MVVPFRPRQTETLDAAALAVLVRADLKRAYPAVTFRVRTSRYAGGSTVHVAWTDGPLERAVENALDLYRVVGFDGSTDSTTNAGPVRLEDGRFVSIYARVSTHRDHSAALRARVAAWMARNPEKATDPQMGPLTAYQVAHRAFLVGVHLAIVPWHVRL